MLTFVYVILYSLSYYKSNQMDAAQGAIHVLEPARQYSKLHGELTKLSDNARERRMRFTGYRRENGPLS